MLIKESLRTRIENFYKFNWHLFTFMLIFSILSTWYVYYQSMKRADRNEKLLIANIQYVTVATADGRFMKLKREPVDMKGDIFKRYIANLGSSFIWDASIVTAGFKEKPKKAIDIYKNSQFAKYIVSNYIDSQSAASAILDYYFKRYTEDSLPETIRVLGYKINKYDVNSPDKENENVPEHTLSTWSMDITYKVYTNSWIVEKNKSVERVQYIHMMITGFTNPYQYSTIDNPYGMKMHMRSSLPKKRTSEPQQKYSEQP